MISVPLNSVESSSLGVRAGLIDVIDEHGELDDDDWSFGEVLGVLEVFALHAGFVCVSTTVTGVCTATGWSGAGSGIQ